MNTKFQSTELGNEESPGHNFLYVSCGHTHNQIRAEDKERREGFCLWTRVLLWQCLDSRVQVWGHQEKTCGIILQAIIRNLTETYHFLTQNWYISDAFSPSIHFLTILSIILLLSVVICLTVVRYLTNKDISYHF